MIGAVIVQYALFRFSEKSYYLFPFASDMEISFGFLSKIMGIAYGYLPWAFILFFFLGAGRNITHGYGKLIAIRSCKTVKLCAKEQLRIAVQILGIVFAQILIFGIKDADWQMLNVRKCICMLLLYYSGVLNLVLLQFLLEMKLDMEKANLIVNIFAVGSLLAGNRIIPSDRFNAAAIVFFPNLAFASRNGIISSEYVMLETYISLAGSVMMLAVLVILALVVVQRKDLF